MKRKQKKEKRVSLPLPQPARISAKGGHEAG